MMQRFTRPLNALAQNTFTRINLLLTLSLLGGLTGAAVLQTEWGDTCFNTTSASLIWLILYGTLFAALPFVFLQGVRELGKLRPISPSLHTGWFLALTLILFLIPGWVTKSFDAIFIQDEIPTLAFRTTTAVYLSGLACFSSALGLAALTQQAIELSPTAASFLQHYFALRRSLSSFVLLIGGVIGLGTLTTGGLQNALQTHDASAAFPPEVTVVYGAYFSLTLSVLSLPTAWMLLVKGNAYLDQHLPLHS
ncbi:MAG: hypothetical protein AAF329_04690 [Cyanobacteria bacterium P01_A01_bin.17]